MSNRRPEVVEQPEIETLSLRAEGGPETAVATFQKLEKLVPLKGRKFYGVYDTERGIYRACTKREEDDESQNWPLEHFIIPGGLYAYRKIIGEHDELVKQVPGVFQELAGRWAVDSTRPSVEFYRRLDEFRLYLPVTTP